MMSESSKRHSKFLSLIFILKCLSKASVIRLFHNRVNKETTYFHASDIMTFSQRVCNEAHDKKKKNRTDIC